MAEPTIRVRWDCAAGLQLSAADANVRLDGERGAMISGGLPLDAAAFIAVTSKAALGMLPAAAAANVRQVNVTALGHSRGARTAPLSRWQRPDRLVRALLAFCSRVAAAAALAIAAACC